MLVGLVAAGPALVRQLAGSSAEDRVPTFLVERSDFVRRVHADGNLEAVKATQLSPPARARGPLRIAWLEQNGTRVDAGDVVIRFDPSELEQSLRQGQSDRATAESRISQKQVREESALRNLDRDADLAVLELDHSSQFQSKDPEIFSRVEIIESEIDGELAAERKRHAEDLREIRADLAGVELDLLDIEKRKAELVISQSETELQELEVEAPHEGIFVVKEIWGQVAQVGSMVWAGNPVAEIPQLDEMEAKVYVLEADAGGLVPGLEARVTLDAHPGLVYSAKIKKVDALAMRRNRRVPVQYFGVTLELERTEPERMKPGQRVQATILFDEQSDVIAIPRQAVFHEEDRTLVYVERGGDFEPAEVELGIAGLGRVVVTSGLEPGARVALRDPTRPTGEIETEDEGGETAGPAG